MDKLPPGVLAVLLGACAALLLKFVFKWMDKQESAPSRTEALISELKRELTESFSRLTTDVRQVFETLGEHSTEVATLARTVSMNISRLDKMDTRIETLRLENERLCNDRRHEIGISIDRLRMELDKLIEEVLIDRTRKASERSDP